MPLLLDVELIRIDGEVAFEDQLKMLLHLFVACAQCAEFQDSVC